MRRKKRFIFLVIIITLISFCLIDCYLVMGKKQKPFFCINVSKELNGGSGTYIGLGYGYELKGNFMPESENYGVKEYLFKILGIKIISNQNEKK